jgi:hypothetical protein
MIEHLNPWSPHTKVTSSVDIDDLRITFKRTIRVPDNDETSALPPDMGDFPLYKVDSYTDKLPLSMARKGGLFIPMYHKSTLAGAIVKQNTDFSWLEREAMWIGFESSRHYAIKIYVGGINVVSGEPSEPTLATSLRRRGLIQQGKSVQDYVVAPYQQWLDGIAVEPGKVRQFVAMPVGTGHSIEAQMTGEETTAGIQFEITRLDPHARPGDTITKEGVPADQIRFIFNGKQIEGNLKCFSGVIHAYKDCTNTHQATDGKSLFEYDIQNVKSPTPSTCNLKTMS